jgi:hypothetical protein
VGFIGTSFPKLESWLRSFSIELFADVLKPAWIEAALKDHQRQSLRIRKLPAGLVVWLCVALGLYRTLSIPNVLSRLGTIFGVGSLWDDAVAPASTAITEARDRVGFGPLRAVFEKLRDHLVMAYRERMLWKGMPLLALDGTTFKAPDSPENRRRFGLPGSSRGGRAGFPLLRSVALVSPLLRFVLGARFGPYRRGELDMALSLVPEIPSGSMLVMDRAYAAWRFLFPLRERGHHFLVRLPKHFKARRVWALGAGDAVVEAEMHHAFRQSYPEFPRKVLVRQLHVRIRGVEMRYWTSLLDPKAFPAVDLVRLYAQRWEEELIFDELKTHQAGLTTVNRPVLFRSQTTRRVLQEAWGLMIAYNLVRTLMAQAAHERKLEAIRLSFVDALERIRQASLLMAAARTRDLPRIYAELIEALGRSRLPKRRGRDNPREVVIKMSNYAKKWKSA